MRYTYRTRFRFLSLGIGGLWKRENEKRITRWREGDRLHTSTELWYVQCGRLLRGLCLGMLGALCFKKCNCFLVLKEFSLMKVASGWICAINIVNTNTSCQKYIYIYLNPNFQCLLPVCLKSAYFRAWCKTFIPTLNRCRNWSNVPSGRGNVTHTWRWPHDYTMKLIKILI